MQASYLEGRNNQTASLKSDTQQHKFNRFRHKQNHERAHEALDQKTPSFNHESPAREMPNKILPTEYTERFEGRYVSTNCSIR